MLSRELFGNSNLILSSHNNHFGHFVGDDLPLLLLSSCNMSINSKYLLSTFGPCNKGITRELNDLSQNGRNSIKQNYSFTYNFRMQSNNCITYSLPRITGRSYLLRQILHLRNETGGIQDKFGLPHKGEKYLVLRLGDYESRISLNTIIEKAKSIGFMVVDLSKLSIHESIAYLKKAKTIICESGSTTLITSITAPPDCHIISLQPDCLFKSMRIDMLGEELVISWDTTLMFQWYLERSRNTKKYNPQA